MIGIEDTQRVDGCSPDSSSPVAVSETSQEAKGAKAND